MTLRTLLFKLFNPFAYNTLLFVLTFLLFCPGHFLAQDQSVISGKLSNPERLSLDSLINWLEENATESIEIFEPVLMVALEKAYQENDPAKLGDTHSRIADWHANGYYPSDSVLFHSQKALEFYRQDKDSLAIANALKTISIDYINVADNKSSLSAILESIDLFEKLHNQEGLAGAYRNISTLYTKTEEPHKAISYANKAIEIYEKTESYSPLAITYLNLIESYNNIGKHEQAIESAETCINIINTKAPDNIFVAVRAYAFRHDVYIKLKDYDKALADAQKAWQITSDAVGKKRAEPYRLEIGNALLKMGRHKEALDHLEIAVNAYLSNGSSNYSQPHTWLGECYKALGMYEKAIAQQELAYDIERKMLEEKVENLESEGIIKYESGKKDQEIALQDQQLKQKSRIQALILTIASLLSLMLVLLYRNFVKNRKITKELEKKNSENELLLKEIHHRVKNNLQTISSLLNLQSESIKDDAAYDAVQESKNRVASMALIHQKLYQGENLAAVEMKDYFMTISKAIKESFGEKARNIDLQIEMPELELDVDTAVPIGLITNELLTNALKHAFIKKASGNIQISLKRNEAELELKIQDNGNGHTTASISDEQGFGTLLVQLLTAQLGGQLQKTSNNGTTIVLKFQEQEKSAA